MKLTTLFTLTLISIAAHAATFEGDVTDWKKSENAHFTNPEANFKAAMKIVRENYADASITDEELYRAATSGMLASLNTGEEKWNVLYSPREVEDLQIEMSGHLTGIGAVLRWEPETGHAKVDAALPGSAALKAGLQKGDEILSVNGEKFKGRSLQDMVAIIRGPSSESVSLKILRDDEIKILKVTRASVQLEDCQAHQLGDQTGLLRISMFASKTPAHVRAKLDELKGVKKLILDLRDNEGGGFDQALAVADLFANKGVTVAKTKNRQGKIEEYKAKDTAWNPDTKIIVLIDKETMSGAELLASSLAENRKAILLGNTTRGKWSVQSVETLPNKFAIKYSIMEFQSPSGKNYQGVGLKPDFAVELPKQTVTERWAETNPVSMKANDSQLKAALAL